MITAENGSLVLTTPYNPGFIASLKSAIPEYARRWDASRKVWLIDPRHKQSLIQLIQTYYNVDVDIPDTAQTNRTTEIFELRYVGACKPREGETEPIALACDKNGNWNVLFPQSVLQTWFTGFTDPTIASSLYGILGIGRDANEQEIKSAYRRLARQWHPDICKETNAAERFMEIQRAYEILKDPATRRKYDAGLTLQTSNQQTYNSSQYSTQYYRAPLRCGIVMVEGFKTLGRFRVSKIIAWNDIVNQQGQTLVVSWAPGADHWTENWI